MDFSDPCVVCGNEFDRFDSHCPFCGSLRDTVHKRASGPLYQRVNLEKGMPLVEQALRRMENELERARLQGIKVVTLIHGYGSSGKGGAIKEEVRKQLDYLVHKNELREVCPGELLGKRHGRYRSLISRYPGLKREGDLERANPGITVVVL